MEIIRYKTLAAMLTSLDCLEQTRMFLVPQSIYAIFEVIKNGCQDLWLSKQNEKNKKTEL